MERNDLFSEALGQAPDAVLITDADLSAPGPIIRYANAPFCRLTGYAAEELVGRSPRLLQGPDTDRKVLDTLRSELSAGRRFLGTTVNYRKDGTPFHIEWHVSPIASADGRVTHYMSVHRDISQRVRRDRDLGEHAGRLLGRLRDGEARRRELEAANAHLRSLATTDGLTGLSNHRHFHAALTAARAAADVVSLLMLDVDHFKALNDTFGHPAGDAVLQAVADAVKGCVRAEDTTARYGGEEFAVLLPGRDEDHALAVAERVRAAVAGLASLPRAVTVSVGVATVRAGDGVDRGLVDEADAALYAAKAQGRNRVRHHRHLQARKGAAAATAVTAATASACKDACAPSPGGCLRCEAVPAARAPAAGAALLLGAVDADADATLRGVLTAAGFEFAAVGPVVVVREVRGRLAEVGTLLKDRLSPYTRSCVQAAYVPGGVATPEAAMAALMSARPLAEMIQHIEHEWVRDALSQNGLFSVFHPIVDAAAGTAVAFEALLRARGGADGKVMGAGQIIGACEKLNLLHQLDQRARQAAIRGAAEHLPPGSRVFINFLPNTIYDPEICLRTTMEAAATHGLAMSRLVFEVVETEKIPDMAQLLHILDYYRDRGVGTAIDDMGAGHTSLEYITALRPDYVKIDREFMLAAEADPAGMRAMDAIIAASHEHGARVIAEGIETEAQAALCTRAGVDLLQGFLFAKPACPPQPVRLPASLRRAA